MSTRQRYMTVAVVAMEFLLVTLFCSGIGGADTAPPPSCGPAAPANCIALSHSTTIGPDPKPVGVSCQNTATGFLGTFGTCGALVQRSGDFFLLSNAHVLARMNAKGAFEARRGEIVNLPAFVDGTLANPSIAVGIFWQAQPIKFAAGDLNTIDAALAQVTQPQRLRLSGEIQDIGIPIGVGRDGHVIDEAGLERLVKAHAILAKSGRTTGCTQGTIIAMNSTVMIPYPPTATFKKVIVIREDAQIACSPDPNPSSKCSVGTPNVGNFCMTDAACGGIPPHTGDCLPAIAARGDSGSLWVTRDARIVDQETGAFDLMPVGLLFGGSGPANGSAGPGIAGRFSLANPMRDVLGRFGVSIVGTPRPRVIPIVDR